MGYQHILLFEIDLIHRYYPGEVNIALTAEPTPETEELLKGMRMVFRGKPGKAEVFFKGTLNPDNTVEPFLDIDENMNDYDTEDPTIFRFYLYNNDPFYLNYTDLGVENLNRQILYFRGLKADPPISPAIPWKSVVPLEFDDPVEALTISSSKFEYELFADTGQAPDPIFLDIYNHLDDGSNDHLVQTIEVEYEPVSEAYIAQVDLSNQPRGKYILKYNSTEEGIYIDEFLFGRKPFGVLEVYKEEWWPNIATIGTYRDVPLTYSLRFTPRRDAWYYYIVLKSGNHTVSSTYEILDDETTNPDDNRYLNGLIHFPPFVCEDVTPGGGADIDGYPVKIFKCTTGITGDEDITYLQESKPDLTLYKDSAQLLTNLPNPDIQSINAEIIIYV